MKKVIIHIMVMALLAGTLGFAGEKKNLRVAVTIDDLPFVLAGKPKGDYPDLKKKKTAQLIKKVCDFKVPAVGFVVAGRLNKEGKKDTVNRELINMWLDAGLELGNHTYSHPSLHKIPVEDYIVNIEKAHQLLKPVLDKKGKTLRYFRHSFLHTGRTMDIKKQVTTVLHKKNYTIAPVTVDNSDWLFALAYNKAGDDKALKTKIADSYIDYMGKKVAYWESQSQALLGYQVNHILLLHANLLNADHIQRLFTMLKNRGYTFITMEEALKDKTYLLGDQFTGRAGISWIHRWAIAKGKKRAFFGDEPETPLFIKKTAEMYSE
ncbi:MAG: polysaccharide deacetylase family protein [bacterium]|nr:polysaccharide deacetylase family protein [bacterium]